MQNYRIWRFLIIFGFSVVAVVALIYYRQSNEAPTSGSINEESPVKYSTPQYLIPLSAVDKKALIKDAVHDAEQVAKDIGMNENDIGIAKRNAKMVTDKYLRPYPD